MKDDAALLREHAGENSEDAFRELVQRHAPMVYSAALRQVGSAAQAEDVTQVVFSILARSAPKLVDRPVLAGWLHQTARYAALKTIRAERRRRDREREAAPMNQHDDASQALWRQIEPHLDEAIDTLGETDRNAVMLRYFDGRNLRDVGEALGVSEDAAQKRVARALDKIRAFFTRRKVAVSAGVIAGLLPGNAVVAAPTGLIQAISGSAIAGTASVSTVNLLNETMNLIFWTKVKAAVPAVVAGVVVVGAPIAVQQHSITALKAENDALRQQLAAKPKTAAMAPPIIRKDQLTELRREAAEVHALRAEIGRLRDREKARTAEVQRLEKASTELQRKLVAGKSKRAAADRIVAQAKDEGERARRVNQLKQMALAFLRARNEGVIPASIAELGTLIGANEATLNDLRARLVFFQHDNVKRGGPNWQYRIIAADRAPTTIADGSQYWLYALLDGSVITSRQAPPADGLLPVNMRR